MQADAIVYQLDRMADTQMYIAIATSVVAIFALGIAVAALFALIRVRKLVERGMDDIKPLSQPAVAAVTRMAENAREVSETVKVRVNDLMKTVDDINERLRDGAEAVEDRVRSFGVVVDVVQGEAEKIMVDAASTARGVHTARETLRERKALRQPPLDVDPDEDVFD